MPSRVMRNSSSLRAKGGDATFPGLAELVTVGPDSVPGGAPGTQVCLIVVPAGCYYCFVHRTIMSIYIHAFILHVCLPPKLGMCRSEQLPVWSAALAVSH